jgi:threonine/homoserine/homoserine lactone efflux protein
VLEQFFIAIILGLTGGIMPGPIILLAFSEILKSPKKGLANGGIYLIVAGLTEFAIGLFLVATSSWLNIPEIILHSIAIIGSVLLGYIAYQVYKIRKIEYDNSKHKIGVWHIFILMLFNGPMWIFWISICVPSALKLGDLVNFGQYLFIVIFEISMMFGLGVMLFGFNSFRKVFTNEKLIRKIFIILSILLFIIAAKILYSEITFFVEFLHS